MKRIKDELNSYLSSSKGDSQQRKEAFADKDVVDFLGKNSDRLTIDGINSSWINLWYYHVGKLGEDKSSSGYTPKLCVAGEGVEVSYAPTKEVAKEDEERAIRHRVELIDLPPRLKKVRLCDLDRSEGRAAVLDALKQFIEDLSVDPNSQGWYLTGEFGVGKTYMMAGLANEVARMGKTVVFIHMPSFIAGLSSYFGNGSSLSNEIKRLSKADVLILDDIGAESLSDWSRDDVLGVILQARMDNDLPTFFTSNLTMDELKEHLSRTKSGVDSVKAARLMQRIRYLTAELEVGGVNRRF